MYSFCTIDKMTDTSSTAPSLDDPNNSNTTSISMANHLPPQQQQQQQNYAAGNSLQLRRQPTNTLLAPGSTTSEFETHSVHSGRSTSTRRSAEGGAQAHKEGCFRKLCLNSKFPLRKQLMLTFGTVHVLTILFVVMICVVVWIVSAQSVRAIALESFESLFTRTQGLTARYIAETVSPQLIPEDLVRYVKESVSDRFIGYPDYPGYEDDTLVPFLDVETQRNQYPIRGRPLPLDWEVASNPQLEKVNHKNSWEHMQNRFDWYDGRPDRNAAVEDPVSTSTAVYFLQGMCDPFVPPLRTSDNRVPPTYYQNCTKENNNMVTGGAIAPTPTNYHIQTRAADLTPLLKSLYEYHQNVRSLGVYFANGGSGATLHFPAIQLDTNRNYESIGCDWLLETPHPYNPVQPIIANDSPTKQQIQYSTICRPKGVKVSARVYNPLERGWCQKQATDPRKIHVAGPLYDNAFYTKSIHSIVVGQAVYDKFTNEFVACIAIELVFDNMKQFLINSRITEHSEISIVTYDDKGTVIASSAWDKPKAANLTTEGLFTIDEIESGVTQQTYQIFKHLVDYNLYDHKDVWNAQEIAQIYNQYTHQTKDGYFITGYPIPPPPETYKPGYTPEFIAIVAIPIHEVNKEVDNVSEHIERALINVVTLSMAVAAAGLVLIIVAIICVSRSLTTPLQYMNTVAADIFNHDFEDDQSGRSGSTRGSSAAISTAGVGGGGKLDDPRKGLGFASYALANNQRKCRPRTEIDDVVQEFQKMVSNFSGFSMAKSMKANIREIKNIVDITSSSNMTKLFETLYVSRRTTSFPYNFEESKEVGLSSGSTSSPMGRKNFGSNLLKSPNGGGDPFHEEEILQDSSVSQGVLSSDNFVEGGPNKGEGSTNNMLEVKGKTKQRGLASSLYFWVILLMVTPFLATTVTVSGVVIHKLTLDLSSIIKEAKQNFVLLEKKALDIYVNHRAYLVSTKMERAIRDLHVFTRYTDWILFNGVQRTDSYPAFYTDEWMLQSGNGNDPCECAWDYENQVCYDKESIQYRYSQRQFFSSQSQDNWPNGDRNTTSYPEVAYSNTSIEFWTDQRTVPGYEKGSFSKGYETLYDRLRSVAALPIGQPMFNQDINKEYYWASYVSFESDGTFAGYECTDDVYWLSNYVQRSTESAELNPDICPLGKHGYDPRCRPWYYTGKALYHKNKTDVHVTAPYIYAGGTSIGQSCTSPIVDPTNGKYVGQTLVDFDATFLLNLINGINTPLNDGGFPLLITVEDKDGVLVNDTVIGPGYNGSSPMSIVNVVFANDTNCVSSSADEDGNHQQCEEDRKKFQTIIGDMKQGNYGTDSFTRSGPDGTTQHIHLAYAPVVVRSFASVDSSNFARGVKPNQHLSYSLALAETEDGLVAPFTEVEEQLNKQVLYCLIILVTVISISAITVICVSYKVTLSITEPLIYLLELIGYINRLDSYEQAPKIESARRGQSLEIVNVSKTMESLYRVVCSANIAFFTGDMEEAYVALNDALKLYKHLGNKKGISIASNNLGNIMLTMFRTMEATGERTFCGFTRTQIINKGLSYFHEAIRLGEKAYDVFYETQGWSPCCLEFMQHLSNRYFNRAMFLLTVKNAHAKPKEIEELGFRDLQIAKDMDLEIIEEGTQAGWGIRTMETLFEVSLTRLKGHIQLREMGYSDDWDVKESLEAAFKTVKNEMKNPGSTLFQQLECAGRMQQVETELMRYHVLTGDIYTASQVAIRMLVEDEHILIESLLKSLEVLLSYLELPEIREDASSATVKRQLVEFQNRLQSQNNKAIEEEVEQQSQDPSSLAFESKGKTGGNRRSSVKESQRGDFTMETF